jgi:hypothetical protein
MSTLPREFRDASLIRHAVAARMPDEATSAIEAGIRSAFTAYSRDDDLRLEERYLDQARRMLPFDDEHSKGIGC